VVIARDITAWSLMLGGLSYLAYAAVKARARKE